MKWSFLWVAHYLSKSYLLFQLDGDTVYNTQEWADAKLKISSCKFSPLLTAVGNYPTTNNKKESFVQVS